MSDKTLIKRLTVDKNYKTISDDSFYVYYRYYPKFEDLPKICQSDEVRKEHAEYWLNHTNNER